jgi:16S rRNA (cytidine1402-2'-O)-methyltransferase
MPVPGILYVVATPIGNRADITERARETLQRVDLIAAEDTRHSGQFLAQMGVARPLIAVHDHNESQRIDEILATLSRGASVALISDAGTPLISDPGYRLVAAVAAAGITVVAVPGACAAIAALSVAGLPTDRFVFEGFLPPKSAARRARLLELVNEPRTLVFYEAPHRVRDTLEDLSAVFGGERPVALARELTKLHEQIYRGSLSALLDKSAVDTNMSRGEAVLVVGGAAASPEAGEDVQIRADQLLRSLLPLLPLSQVVDLVAEWTGDRRNKVYERALTLKQELSA